MSDHRFHRRHRQFGTGKCGRVKVEGGHYCSMAQTMIHHFFADNDVSSLILLMIIGDWRRSMEKGALYAGIGLETHHRMRRSGTTAANNQSM